MKLQPTHAQDWNLDSERDNIYYNVIFNNTSENETPTIAKYSFTNTLIILENPSEYFCSIIRFEIPLSEVPLYIMPIVPNQSNANLTPMSVRISFGGNNYYQNIIYVPDNNIAAPVQNQTSQVITPYYYVYSYQNLINAINTAIATQYAAFATANPTAPQATPNSAPYFYYFRTIELITLVINDSWAGNTALL